MDATVRLDLANLISPLGLLKFKSALNQMDSGEVLEVSLQDPEVFENIIKIVEPSHDQVIGADRISGCLRLFIEKG